MELINMILIIMVTLTSMAAILFLLNIKQRRTKKIDLDNIKFYLEEYLKEFNAFKILELDTKLKIDNIENSMYTSTTYITAIFAIIIIYVFRLIGSKSVKSIENLIIIMGIAIIFIAFAFIVLFLTKKAITKKMILKNNILEVNDNKEIKTYQLDRCNIKFDLKTIHKDTPNTHRYIDIYINNDKLTSKEFNIYDFETYIAFIIFANLLKTQDIEKIKNLNNNDIEKFQQNYTYTTEDSSVTKEI